MAEARLPDDGWSKAEVLAQLRREAKSGRTVVAVQVFLAPELKPEDVETAFESVKHNAETMATASAPPAAVGKLRRTSRSFSVQADPDTIEKIVQRPDVTAILPCEIDDILPKPTQLHHHKDW